jgi:NYN domain
VTCRLAVFLDYQNVHLTAHGLYGRPGAPVETSLVHPLRIAERIVAKRRIASNVVSVRVVRGRPNPEHHPIPAAANDAQTAAWERDRRVRVFRRPLNYRGWPEHPPREKGVDVALAVDLIESALLGQYDAAVVPGVPDPVAAEVRAHEARNRQELWTAFP